MAIPILAVAAGAHILGNLFKKRPTYNLPPDLEFFGPGFEHVRAALEHKNQAAFGGAGADLREMLANQGVLGNQGALTDAFTRLSIGEGQAIAGGNADLYGTEYGAKRNFDQTKYLAALGKNKDMYAADAGARANELGLIESLGGSLGKILGGKTPAATTTVAPVVPGAPGITPGRGAYSPTDPFYGTGLGLEQQDQHSKVRQLLKALLGF